MGLNAKRGDIIYAVRAGGIYRHYGIYVNDSCVIHYVGKFSKNCRVRQTSLKKFQKNSPCYVQPYHKGVYSSEETVKRAKSRIGKNGYSFFFNNCEHFALWCKTGIAESCQVEPVLERAFEMTEKVVNVLDGISDALYALSALV